MRKAKEKMDEIYDATVAARQQMYDARDFLKSNLTEGVFVDDLTELKDNLDLIKGDGIDQQFLDVLAAIHRYVTEAPKSKDSTFYKTERLLRMLYENLYQLPKYYNCYTDKVAVVSTVLRRCKEGDQSLTNLNEQEKDAKDTNWESCQNMIGMEPISDDALEKLIEKKATEENFNKVCELNSEDRKNTVCIKKCNGGKQAKNTAIAQTLDVSVKVVDILLKKCEVCQAVIDGVCFMRNRGIKDKDIHEELYPQYTLKEIKSIKCS
ncbi:uncharacterized protein LOC116302910 [Actinia tenebrosa]|uniref:Uncharacterized protein LOC116302910 n=1 Tax=Actinia tenebrosa TaxID=6105 RepID=A0A6P8INU6_ACTTE|nr:uncharacterized protein LOC116302910 [Actinia tenebrosa]